MSGIRAVVKGGRLIVDEPTTLSEGTVLDLVLDDEGDDLSPEERQALHAAIARAWASAKQGNVRSVEMFIDELRERK